MGVSVSVEVLSAVRCDRTLTTSRPLRRFAAVRSVAHPVPGVPELLHSNSLDPRVSLTYLRI